MWGTFLQMEYFNHHQCCVTTEHFYTYPNKIIVYNEGEKWHGWTVLLVGITGWIRVSTMIWRSLVFITTECVLFRNTIYTRKCHEVVVLQAKLSILCPVELNGWDLSSTLSSRWNERNVMLPELLCISNNAQFFCCRLHLFIFENTAILLCTIRLP